MFKDEEPAQAWVQEGVHEGVDAPQAGGRKECALYRHWDVEGRLLYVGCSMTPAGRTAAHVSSSRWARDVATITIVWFATKVEALQMELQAIKDEAPMYNYAGAADAVRQRLRHGYVDCRSRNPKDPQAPMTNAQRQAAYRARKRAAK